MSSTTTSVVEQRNKELAKTTWGLLEQMKPSIAAVLPKHLTPERMAMIAFTAMRRNPRLMECSRESIIGSILQAAMLGLEPSGPLGHGALIPYKRECQFQPMYQGLLELARRSGFIKDVQLRPVYDGDTYSYRFGLDPEITHVPMTGEGADNPDRKMTHAYCIIRLRDGGVQWDQMSFQQGIAHGRRYSPSFDRDLGKFKPGSVWADNPEAMVLKTICKRTLKLCPKSPELAAALVLDDMSEQGKPTRMTKVDEGVFDVEFDQPEVPEQQGPERSTVNLDDIKPGKEENRGHGNEGLDQTQNGFIDGPQQDSIKNLFKDSLKPALRKNADALLAEYLKSQGIVNDGGEPDITRVKKASLGDVREGAVSHARSLQ